jgi:hypothetical protein
MVPDAILVLVMEDRFREGVEAIRQHTNLPLKASIATYRAIEDEMGFVEYVPCNHCEETGKVRRRKQEFRRRVRRCCTCTGNCRVKDGSKLGEGWYCALDKTAPENAPALREDA